MLDARKILLRFILGAIAAAALGGVGLLLMPGSGWFYRSASLSALLVALVSVGLFAYLKPYRNPETRLGGVVGMCIMAVELVIGAVFIWAPQFLGAGHEGFFFMLMASLFITGAYAAKMLSRMNRPGERLSSFLAVGFAVLLFALLMVSAANLTVAGSVAAKEFGWSLFRAALFMAVTALLVPFCLIGFGRGAQRWLDLVGIVGALGAIAGCGIGWWMSFSEPMIEYMFIGCYAFGLTGAVAQVLLRSDQPPQNLTLRRITVALSACHGALLAYAAFDGWNSGSTRFAIGFLILWMCAWLAVAVLSVVNKREKLTLAAAVDFTRVTVTCPRCARLSPIPVGEAGGLCSGCKLHFTVNVALARCGKCGYDLKDLSAVTCPECGAAVG